MDAKQSLVHNWLTKSRRDLLSAKRLARGTEPYLDTAIYHCQQSVEKAIKGWLVYHDQPFEKTHDLRLLVTQAAEVDQNLQTGLISLCKSLPMQPRIGILVKYWSLPRKNSRKPSKSSASFTSLSVQCSRLN